MPKTDAIVLENFFPKAHSVELREGCIDHAFGMAHDPKTLMSWNGKSSQKLFAASDVGIYDVTLPVITSTIVATLTNPFVQSANINVAGGSFLVVVNGVDKMLQYDGTTWKVIDGASTPAITGLATTELDYVAVLKKRLWFVQKNSMSAWYLPAGQIAGALTEFPLGTVFPKGGKLVAIANWTIDGGDGADDYGVFMSSEGEVAVYKGTDPASSSTWNLVGSYYIGEPLGKNVFCQYGGDLLVLCQNGLFPLSKALQSSVINFKDALTTKIDTAFTEAATLYGANPGWQAIAFPQGSLILVNIPVTTEYIIQYVMNSVTGAWCKFTGWKAYSWEVFNKKLYFATTAKLGEALHGKNDFGAYINGRAVQAYTNLGTQGLKHIKLVQPMFNQDGVTNLKLGFDTDFAVNNFDSMTLSVADAGDKWDTAKWDSALWAGSGEAVHNWATVFVKECYAAAFRLQVSTTSVTLKWNATNIQFERGYGL